MVIVPQPRRPAPGLFICGMFSNKPVWCYKTVVTGLSAKLHVHAPDFFYAISYNRKSIVIQLS
ncbi:hypothetical protein DXN05_03785 [Deminuibacter soli]|uniref:Uncharacterized protein n=1 Tax=Deminuibacter soli TaxID=2291815 RepID=A0A3E1NQA3_9BACT|nr:hypothetical protein DXN05_03785 [Deminuibacter soli]